VVVVTRHERCWWIAAEGGFMRHRLTFLAGLCLGLAICPAAQAAKERGARNRVERLQNPALRQIELGSWAVSRRRPCAT
jgi:hypothetical protein